MIRMWFLVLVAALMHVACDDGGLAEIPPEQSIEAVIEAEMTRLHIPGLSYVVLEDDKVLRIGGLGIQDISSRTPVEPSTVFEIGSLTKPVTATAVMMLVEDGRLSLSDSITDLLPGVPAAWAGVTVHHLLTHTSGIKSYTDLMDFLTLARTDFAGGEVLDMIADYPLDFEPGSAWDYNNSGYYLLGLLVEEVSGMSYSTFLATRIFEPLGMEATGLTDAGGEESRHAVGYSWEEGEWTPMDGITPTAGYAAGSLVSTVDDLAKWSAALFSGELLQPSTLEQMLTPAVLDDGESAGYGYGWYVGMYEGSDVVEHSGASPGFTAYALHFLEEDVTVIVLANLWLLDSRSLARNIGMMIRAIGTHHFSSAAEVPGDSAAFSPGDTSMVLLGGE